VILGRGYLSPGNITSSSRFELAGSCEALPPLLRAPWLDVDYERCAVVLVCVPWFGFARDSCGSKRRDLPSSVALSDNKRMFTHALGWAQRHWMMCRSTRGPSVCVVVVPSYSNALRDVALRVSSRSCLAALSVGVFVRRYCGWNLDECHWRHRVRLRRVISRCMCLSGCEILRVI
jgi:hypothetical protein